MNEKTSVPSAAKARLEERRGAALRQIRKRSGLTATYVAADLRMHPTRLSRIEKGTTSLDQAELDQLLSVIRANSADRRLIAAIDAEINSETTMVAFPETATFTEIQKQIWGDIWDTRHFVTYQLNVVSGLLQTATYARSILEAHPPGILTKPAKDIDNAMRIRLDKQSLLYDPTRTFEFLITESCLTQSAIAPADLAAQCNKISQSSMLPNIQLGVIPHTARMPVHVLGDFLILDRSRMHVELNVSYVEITSPSTIEYYSAVFEMLKGVALYGEDAREFIAGCSHRLMQRAMNEETIHLDDVNS